MAAPPKSTSEKEMNGAINTNLDPSGTFTISLKIPKRDRMAKFKVTEDKAQTEWSDIQEDHGVSLFEYVHELVDAMVSEYILGDSSRSGTYQKALSVDLKKMLSDAAAIDYEVAYGDQLAHAAKSKYQQEYTRNFVDETIANMCSSLRELISRVIS